MLFTSVLSFSSWEILYDRIVSIAPTSQVGKLRHRDVHTMFVGLGRTSATLGSFEKVPMDS